MYPTHPAKQLYQAQHHSVTVSVAAEHPVLGRVFWSRSGDIAHDEICTLTVDPFQALTLPAGWREIASERANAQHVNRLRCDVHQIFTLPGAPSQQLGKRNSVHFAGEIVHLFRASGQTPVEFLKWIELAIWADVPSVARRCSWIDEAIGSTSNKPGILPESHLPTDFDVVGGRSLEPLPLTLH